MQTVSHQNGNYPGSYFQFEESEFSSEELFLDDYSTVVVCVWQTISSIFPFVFRSLAASFFKLIVLASIGKFHCQQTLDDFLNGFIGFALLCSNSERYALMLPFILYFLLSYALMSFDLIQNNSKGPFCTIFTILYIAICQFFMDIDDFLMVNLLNLLNYFLSLPRETNTHECRLLKIYTRFVNTLFYMFNRGIWRN
ncbi:unnamed protein product [Meloidogyne enterolobii]|uniref:Uncharacterized protein n=1 Tax=Meloidogyne enterolobii TaxID=390850 RepID=A0ACB1B7C9_MELEN